MGLRRLLSFMIGARSKRPVRPAAEAVHRSPDAVETEPDLPTWFGSNISWFAIRAEDGLAVAKVFGAVDLQRANWRSGIEAAHRYYSPDMGTFPVFISPPIDGWTLVVGKSFPGPDKPETKEGQEFRRRFRELASHFDDVQFFGSSRVLPHYTWARARAGTTERVFSFIDGPTLVSEGEQTPEEIRLGFFDLRSLDDDGTTSEGHEINGEVRYFGEEEVLDLAGAWSINPMQLNTRDWPAGVGYIASLLHLQ